jgi:hypothetical protein
MTIQNQLFTDLAKFDLGTHVQEYGPPHYPTERNPVGHLNERFWAALVATHNEVLFENRENDFYRYLPSIGIYEPFTEHLLLDQIANDIWNAAQNWRGYDPLAELCNARHLRGVVSHLKGFVQKEGAFDQRRNYIHVKNGVIDLSSGSPQLIPFDPALVSRNSILVCYDRQAKCPRFQAELLAPLPVEDQLLLQKLFGMYVSGTNFLQKIVILQGAAESGKSPASHRCPRFDRRA